MRVEMCVCVCPYYTRRMSLFHYVWFMNRSFDTERLFLSWKALKECHKLIRKFTHFVREEFVHLISASRDHTTAKKQQHSSHVRLVLSVNSILERIVLSQLSIHLQINDFTHTFLSEYRVSCIILMELTSLLLVMKWHTAGLVPSGLHCHCSTIPRRLIRSITTLFCAGFLAHLGLSDKCFNDLLYLNDCRYNHKTSSFSRIVCGLSQANSKYHGRASWRSMEADCPKGLKGQPLKALGSQKTGSYN